ncbi:PREDICTED: immunoglobulin superfamily member 10 [Vollenhovia emeryi]|uniref:immunoglobulin superfamily member 10 n=1 Tax=Vollenhovia emeryi TaxID=411798 RepID=UPI0005F47755|nr:PREDICTED: immunoglobulin superfamily member 10 [Vollenhovia emeryi]
MPCLSNLAYLLTFVAVIAMANVLPRDRNRYPFAPLLANASSRLNAEQLTVLDIFKYSMFKRSPPKKKNNNTLSLTWIKTLRNEPDYMEVTAGNRLELRCEATGNPPPEVHWLLGNDAERQDEHYAQIGPRTNDGFTQVISTYVIDCVKPEHQGLVKCVSVSNNVVRTSVRAILVNGTSDKCDNERPPVFTLYQPYRIAEQRTTVVLPCRVVGEPMPYQFWLDVHGITITPTTHTRHTVLPNGDLEIKDLEWEDMGDYTCMAELGFMQKNVTTFVYPLLPSSSEKRNKDFEYLP